MISHCWYFIRLSTGGRLSAPVGPVRSRDGPPVNFVTKIFPRPFKIPVPVPVNRKRRTAVFCPSRDYCRRVLQRRGPFCLRKLSLLLSLFDFRLIDGRACSLFPPSLPSWVVSRAGQSGALRDACIYGETPRIPGKIWLRLWLSSECCCWIAHPRSFIDGAGVHPVYTRDVKFARVKRVTGRCLQDVARLLRVTVIPS